MPELGYSEVAFFTPDFISEENPVLLLGLLKIAV